MNSIHNLNNPLSNYVASAGSLKNTTNKKPEPSTPKPAGDVDVSTFPANRSLRKYTEIAEQNHQNKQNLIEKDNLRYSAVNAVNQYTYNFNIERIENTNKLLGLSVYA